MRKQRKIFQIKEQDKIPVLNEMKNLNEMKISKLTDKEFKVILIKMLTFLRRMDECRKLQ